MKKFYVITNREKDANLTMTSYIKNYIETKGGICKVQEKLHKKLQSKYNYTNPKNIDADTEAILVLGGDGTVIQAAHDVVDLGIPMLGINLGTLGYLAEIDKENVLSAIEALLEDRFEVEERMMLEGMVDQADGSEMKVALNDIAITRTGILRVVPYHIFVNQRYLTSYKADGIIVATPTGSTGYSMSAGGPIVAPNAQMILITPISPHTINRTSVVLNPTDHITIAVGQLEWFKDAQSELLVKNAGAFEGKDEAIAHFDAAHGIVLTTGDRIEIQRSDKKMKLIRISKDSFLQVLSRKMSE